ncbi:hypothetical protein GCM10027290_51480 [Micromonospora sonneratiae]
MIWLPGVRLYTKWSRPVVGPLGPEDPRDYKNAYRDRLDQMPIDEPTRGELIDEVVRMYRQACAVLGVPPRST